MILSLAFLNFIFSALRLYFCFKARRLISIAWFLIAYFSWFFIPVVMGGSFKHYRTFPGELVTITNETIANAIVFIFIFNVIFFITEASLWKVIGPKKNDQEWVLPVKSVLLNRLQIALFSLMILGTVLYGITSFTHEYRDYVEYRGSGWGLVFLWASSSLITLLALRKKYTLAILACLPFIYFTLQLHIRSFALLSIIPVIIVYMLQVSSEGRSGVLKKILFGGAMLLGVLMLSSAVLMDKQGKGSKGFNLPDSGMPYGTVIVMELTNKFKASTEWDSLTLYGRNLINPFLRFFSTINLTDTAILDIVDPPVVMAQLYDGVPKNWGVYFHYPTLWYMDAYLSFGYYGLMLAIFWAFVLVLWESLITRNILLFGLMLPFYTWHIYMLIRGATAGATVPFSYAVYITFIVAAMVGGLKIFKGSRYNA